MIRMKFADTAPYVRYARYMTVDKSTSLPDAVPCDGRFFYAVDGKGAIKVGDAIYEMAKGDLLFFGARTAYRILPAESSVIYLILNFDYTQDHSHVTSPIPPKSPSLFRDSDVIETVCFEDAPELSHPVHLKRKPEFLDKMTEIEREFSRKILYYEAVISKLLSEILIGCVREIKLQAFPDGYERVNGILKFIHENYGKRITNESLGERFGFHPNYISYLIKRYTGMPLHKYLLSVRLSHAVKLLDDGRATVGEIADRCGFCDIYYFSRVFKQQTGMSPLEYRGKKNIK